MSVYCRQIDVSLMVRWVVFNIMTQHFSEATRESLQSLIAFGGILCEKKGEGEYNLNKVF